MSDSRLNHLGSVLESKNSTLRREAAVAFGKYCLSDDKVAEVLLKYICSPSWDARVAAADALHALLRNMGTFNGKIEDVAVAESLQEINAGYVLKTFKPLLSDDGTALSAGSSGTKVNVHQQRLVLDQHLDMSAVIGVTSAGFLNDTDVLPQSTSNSPRQEPEELLTADCSKLKTEVKVEDFENGAGDRVDCASQNAFLRIPLPLVDACALQLLHVLILDQFNDFVSGRSATAPVRETCAQALGHFLHKTDSNRQTVVLGHLRNLLLMQGERDVLMILKLFYRVLLFTAPASDMVLLENVYITSKTLLEKYGSKLIQSRALLDKIGPWAGCLLLDHRNAVIDVFTYCVDIATSSRDDPLIRMGSEEVRCLSDKEKDDVYITRKIIAAKFLATIIQMHYESRIELDGQPVTEAIQLLFVPFLRSNLLYQNLGAAVILNEWAAVFRDSSNRGVQLDPPVTLLQICDAFLRAPAKNYDELTSAVNHLTMDCKEFVDYCVVRGVDRSKLGMGESISVEEISKMAFDLCLPLLTAPNHIESLTTRYNVFRGAITLMIAYSWPRTPRPYVKVLARAMNMFSSCSNRIPKPEDWAAKDQQHLVLTLLWTNPEKRVLSSQTSNAELMFLVCSTFAVDQLPEFYEHFALDNCPNQQVLLSRLALHDCMWSRVGSTLSDSSTTLILELLTNSNPALRFAGAKAVETFARSRLGDTISRIFHRLSSMLANVSNPHERKGAIEAMLRLSFLDSALAGAVSLLAPLVFVRMTDKLEEVREAAGEAFRNMVPLLALEDVSVAVPGLNEELSAKRVESAEFVNVLSAPGKLTLVETSTIRGLCKTIQLRHYQAEGITWMRFLRKFGLNGILADDMGLGKTLQTLCALALSIDNDVQLSSRCSLIVCPRTLVDHWCNEWRRFFPGRTPARHVEGAPTKWKSAEIVVAAYEELKGNSSLGRVAWNYVVLDEGHVLRNPKTAIWRAANELNCTSRLILSGTPVQN
ncbi:HEAT repeat protein, partial [Ancylostoma ceylanicum]